MNMGKIILSEQRWGRPPCWRSLSNVEDLSLFNFSKKMGGVDVFDRKDIRGFT